MLQSSKFNKNEEGFQHLVLLLVITAAFLLVGAYLVSKRAEGPPSQTEMQGLRASMSSSDDRSVFEKIRDTMMGRDRGGRDGGGSGGGGRGDPGDPGEPGDPGDPGDPGGPGGNPTPPPGAGIMPYPDAPPCANHDPTEYHGVWNYEEGCHYDHTHGYNPYDTIFADIVSSWNQEIGYPWQTPNENELKHKGYVYLYEEFPGCEQFSGIGATFSDNCITHVLYELHSVGTTAAMTTRFHSFRVAARVCDKSMNNCGFVQTGGWADYGVLHCPYKKAPCPLSSDPNPLPGDGGVLPDKVAIDQPPYRAVTTLDLLDRSLQNNELNQFWSTLGPNPVIAAYYPDPYNVRFESAWNAVDGWGGVDPDNTSALNFICQDGSCKFNHTLFQIFTLKLKNLPAGPYSGFTDRNGNIDGSCSSAGPNCVPLIIDENVPGGTAFMNREVRQGDPAYAPYMEFDICFDGSGTPASCGNNNTTTAGWIKPYIP